MFFFYLETTAMLNLQKVKAFLKMTLFTEDVNNFDDVIHEIDSVDITENDLLGLVM